MSRFFISRVLIFALLSATLPIPAYSVAQSLTTLGVGRVQQSSSTPITCVGVQSGSGTDSGDNNRVAGVICTIATSATITACTVAITTTASGNGICGIWATTAGTPSGNPLATSSTIALNTGTTTVAITASLAAGTYFIGWNFSSASTVIGTKPTGCITGTRYTSTSSTTFPNMAMSGASWNDISVCLNVGLAGTTP